MRHWCKLHLSIVLLSGLSAPALSAGSQPDANVEHALWGIGRTGVMCYMEPCPRRGIFPVSADGQERGFPISRLDQPEPHFVSADPFVTQSVATAYSDGSCLVVEARRIGDGLDILRIVGQC